MKDRSRQALSSRKEQTQRQLRVGEMLRHVLADVLTKGHVRDPDLEGKLVTITEVSVSPDMRNATVFCMSLGGKDVEKVMAALNRCQSYLRGELGRAITLKFTPALTFRADPSFDEARSIDDLLRSPKVARDIAKPDMEPGDGAAS